MAAPRCGSGCFALFSKKGKHQKEVVNGCPGLQILKSEASTGAIAEGLRTPWLVDNMALNAGTGGLVLRRSKNLDDRCEDLAAMWGKIVLGADEGDGWVRVADYFLPKAVGGKSVLIAAPGRESEAELTSYRMDDEGRTASAAATGHAVVEASIDPSVCSSSLRGWSDKLNEKILELETKIQKADEQARELVAHQDKTQSAKARAIHSLKRKKLYKEQRDNLLNAQFNVDNIAMETENAEVLLTVKQAMEEATAQLKAQRDKMGGVEAVCELNEERLELQADMMHIQESLASPSLTLDGESGDADLEAELDELYAQQSIQEESDAIGILCQPMDVSSPPVPAKPPQVVEANRVTVVSSNKDNFVYGTVSDTPPRGVGADHVTALEPKNDNFVYGMVSDIPPQGAGVDHVMVFRSGNDKLVYDAAPDTLLANVPKIAFRKQQGSSSAAASTVAGSTTASVAESSPESSYRESIESSPMSVLSPSVSHATRAEFDSRFRQGSHELGNHGLRVEPTLGQPYRQQPERRHDSHREQQLLEPVPDNSAPQPHCRFERVPKLTRLQQHYQSKGTQQSEMIQRLNQQRERRDRAILFGTAAHPSQPSSSGQGLSEAASIRVKGVVPAVPETTAVEDRWLRKSSTVRAKSVDAHSRDRSDRRDITFAVPPSQDPLPSNLVPAKGGRLPALSVGLPALPSFERRSRDSPSSMQVKVRVKETSTDGTIRTKTTCWAPPALDNHLTASPGTSNMYPSTWTAARWDRVDEYDDSKVDIAQSVASKRHPFVRARSASPVRARGLREGAASDAQSQDVPRWDQDWTAIRDAWLFAQNKERAKTSLAFDGSYMTDGGVCTISNGYLQWPDGERTLVSVTAPLPRTVVPKIRLDQFDANGCIDWKKIAPTFPGDSQVSDAMSVCTSPQVGLDSRPTLSISTVDGVFTAKLVNGRLEWSDEDIWTRM